MQKFCVSAPIYCCYEGDTLVFYQHYFNLILKTHRPAGLHEENQLHFSQTQHTCQKFCSLFEQLLFSDKDEWKSSDINML